MSRDLVQTVPPALLLVIQLVASVCLLLILAIPHKPWRAWSPQLGRAALIGVLEPGLTYSVALVGLSMTSAGSASIISATEPVLIVLVAWGLLGQRPSRRLILCIAIAIFGLFLVSGDAGHEGGQASLAGEALIILATLFAAIYVVLSSKIAADFPASILAASQQGVGLIFALVVLGVVQIFGLEAIPAHLPWSTIAYAAFSGLVQYALAFWLYLIGLRTLSAGTAGLWLTLVPLFGLAGAWVWLGEVPSLMMLLGCGLILGSVIMGRSER